MQAVLPARRRLAGNSGAAPEEEQQFETQPYDNYSCGVDDERYEEMEAPITSRSNYSQKSSVYINDNKNKEIWKAVGCNNPAGKLLKQLYGDTPDKVYIKYPALKIRQDDGEKPKWLTNSRNVRCVDPRKDRGRKQKESSVVVPAVGSKPRRKPARIEFVDRRKSKIAIDSEINEIYSEQAVYRPAYRKGTSTETEKRRLQTQNQFKGGKILPPAGTLKAIEGNVPLSMITGNTPEAAMRKAKKLQQQAAMIDKTRKFSKLKAEKDRLNNLFDTVMGEVETINQKITMLSDKPSNNRQIGDLKKELAIHVKELDNIDRIINHLNEENIDDTFG